MMMLSRLGRSTISRSKNVFCAANGGRSSTGGCSSVVYHQDDNDDKLGFLKPSLPPTNTQKHGSVKILDTNFLLPNPRMFPRFFSSHTQPPKNKNSDKEKKGNNQESESEGELNLDATEMLLFATGLLLIQAWYISELTSDPVEEISFEEFKNKLLEPGLVDHIVISSLSVAKIHVRNSPCNQSTADYEGSSIDSPATSQYKYYLDLGYFNTGKVKSFEKNLEEAQKALGIDAHDYVPVTHDAEIVWGKEFRLFATFFYSLAAGVYMHRNMRGAREFTKHVRFGLVWLGFFVPQ